MGTKAWWKRSKRSIPSAHLSPPENSSKPPPVSVERKTSLLTQLCTDHMPLIGHLFRFNRQRHPTAHAVQTPRRTQNTPYSIATCKQHKDTNLSFWPFLKSTSPIRQPSGTTNDTIPVQQGSYQECTVGPRMLQGTYLGGSEARTQYT